MNEKTYLLKEKADKRQWMRCICALLGIVAVTTVIFQYRERKLQENLAEHILRFHVIANSDTSADQKLKLQVRDAIGIEFAEAFTEADSLQDCIRIATEEQEEILSCARKTIESKGYTYPVRVEISEVQFPEKSYGAYTFPAGAYQAVEVVIGSGEGHNWWCVMYPNLCFTDSTYQIEDAVTEEELKRLLTEDTFEELRVQGKLHVKLKVVEEIREFMAET